MSTVANLIADIKIKGQLQADATVLSDADILAIANKELQSVIVPKILSVRENYFYAFKDYNIEGGLKAVRIPPRAIGQKITAVTVIENNKRTSLNKRHPSELSSRLGYRIIGDSLNISTADGTTPIGVLRVEYQCSPPLMVSSPTSSLSAIASVGASSFGTTLGLNGSYELIRNGGSQTTIIPSLTCVSAGLSATNADDLSTDSYTGLVQVGDIIIGQNASHLVPLPVELHDWLAQRVVMRIKEYLGHRDELELAGSKLADMERDGLALLTPRAENDEKVLMDKEVLNWRFW